MIKKTSYTLSMTAIATIWTLSNALGCVLPNLSEGDYHILLGPPVTTGGGRSFFLDQSFSGGSSFNVHGFCATNTIVNSMMLMAQDGSTTSYVTGPGCYISHFIGPDSANAMCDFSNRIEEVNRVFMQDLGKLSDAIDALTCGVDGTHCPK
jgi:hypothetical protein